MLEFYDSEKVLDFTKDTLIFLQKVMEELTSTIREVLSTSDRVVPNELTALIIREFMNWHALQLHFVSELL
jgi:hypothetical protein